MRRLQHTLPFGGAFPPRKNSDLEVLAGEVGRAVPPSTRAVHSRPPCSLCILLRRVN